jgi:hypothetical protein
LRLVPVGDAPLDVPTPPPVVGFALGVFTVSVPATTARCRFARDGREPLAGVVPVSSSPGVFRAI